MFQILFVMFLLLFTIIIVIIINHDTLCALSLSSPPISFETGSHSAAQAGLEVQLSQPLSGAVIAGAPGSSLASTVSILYMLGTTQKGWITGVDREALRALPALPLSRLVTSGRGSTAYNHDGLGLF